MTYALSAPAGEPYPQDVARALVADGQAPLFGDFEAQQAAEARAKLERARAPLFDGE